MAWFRLEEDFVTHPKVAGLSDRAFRFHIAAIAHSAKYLLDGHLTRRSAITVGSLLDYRGVTKLITELVDAGLWELSDEPNQGFRIHDYQEHQRSRADVERERAGARDRMRRHRSPERYNERSPARSQEVRQQSSKEVLEESSRPKGLTSNHNGTTTQAVTQRLEQFVRNGAYQYTDHSLTDELTSQGADPATITALLQLAHTLRETGAA